MTAFSKKTLRDVPLDGETVLLRADYNVPLTDSGEISDDYRIVSSVPTVKYLVEHGCRVVICSHLGRPGGKPNEAESLAPVAVRLEELLGQKVSFVPDCIGDGVRQAAKRLGPGEVLLLENVRFYAAEEANDPAFARDIARATGAAYFVQDGFGVVHRAHATTSAVTTILPSVAGLLVEKEYTMITGAVEKPERPLLAILGGAKIADKIGVIERFVALADKVIIGGAMANTFLQYKGYDIGQSKSEAGLAPVIDRIYEAARHKTEAVDEFIVLPSDVAVAHSLDEDTRRTVVGISEVRHDEYILDIGPESIQAIVEAVNESHTVVWNGTLGLAEREQFAYGSARTAMALAQRPEAVSVIGGGDTADFVLKWDGGRGTSFSHVSTGGGASLELMAGQPMPGIDALLDA